MFHGRLFPRTFLLTCLASISALLFLLAVNHRQPATKTTTSSILTPDTAYFPPLTGPCGDVVNPEKFCSSFPKEKLLDIQVTIKTGIAERSQLEVLLSTYASCISNVIIVSDTTDIVEGHQVYDILADLPTTYAHNNTDWAAYTDQHQSLASGNVVQKTSGGWRLDRFKFLPMVEYAYARQPNAKWHVFIETDTYLFWDNLFRILERLEPDEAHYLGSAVVGAEDRWFAYGGAGFVISRGVLQNLTLSGDHRLSVKYEWMAREDCCGDAVLAYVLHAELGVRLGNMYPTFSGEKPQWVAVHKEEWCLPLLSLHGVEPEQMQSLWRWERCRAFTERAVTFATFLDWSLAPIFVNGIMTRSHWDNGAEVEQQSLHRTSETVCFAACERSRSCFQASYSEGTCRFSKDVRSGQAVVTDSKSSWDLTKLKQLGWTPWSSNGSVLCANTEWPTPKIMLPPKDWAQFFHLKEWP